MRKEVDPKGRVYYPRREGEEYIKNWRPIILKAWQGNMDIQGDDDNWTHIFSYYGKYFAKWVNHSLIVILIFYFLGSIVYWFLALALLEFWYAWAINLAEYEESVGDVTCDYRLRLEEELDNRDNRMNGFLFLQLEKSSFLHHLDYDPDYIISSYLETFKDNYFGLFNIMGSYNRAEHIKFISEDPNIIGWTDPYDYENDVKKDELEEEEEGLLASTGRRFDATWQDITGRVSHAGRKNQQGRGTRDRADD